MLTHTHRSGLIRLASSLDRGEAKRKSLLTFLAAEKWIPKDLEEGRCTPAPNPDCPVGSPQYNLAQTFKEHPEWGEKGGKKAKDIPKDVERYVEEGKAQGMDESKAWAVAWSRWCRYKNPGSPHCKKDKGDYFSGRKASNRTLRRSLIRLATTMPNGSRARQEILHLLASNECLTTKVAHKPLNPEVTKRAVRDGNAFMTYRIDAAASAKGTSKFYEGFIRPEDGGYMVVRQWGALTDKGTPKNTRSKVVFFEDLPDAQRDISRELAKRIKRQYVDAFGASHKDPTSGKKLPMGQYPIGLYRPGLGFGWGTQSIGACIPALRDLRGSLAAAIDSIESGDTALEIQQDLTSALTDIERGAIEDSTMASKLKRQIGGAVRRLTGGPRFLPDPEGRKLRKQLVTIHNYITKQLAYCV